MAILNATPDSFFAGSRTADEAAIERRVRECLDQGADLIDVGGYSSRPGADAVAPDEEWRRVSTALGVVRRLAPHMPVSVDTFRASVAAQAAERFGEVIINDISAGELDPAMPATVARLGVPYIIMHMKGDPQTMQTLTDYRSDIVTEVCGYFGRRVAERPRASGAGTSSSTPDSDSPKPSNRIMNCWPDCTSCARWVSRCWQGCRASR